MLKHIVMWKFLAEAEGRSKAENIDLVANGLLSLRTEIPEIRFMQVGRDLTHGADSYDLALILDVANREALDAYRVNPLHQEVAAYVHKVISARVSCDFNLSM